MLYQITFYVPISHLEIVKEAMFAKGAGRVGNYECCAWQVLGQGQFRPNENSKPFIGKPNQIETVAEYKVEMVCDEKYIKDVITALKKNHPYEEAAYAIHKLLEL